MLNAIMPGKYKTEMTRRSFLRLAALSLGGIALRPLERFVRLPEFPNAERLGRICAGKVDVMARPDSESQVVGALFEDAIVPWIKEVVGRRPMWLSQRYVETPDGYIYAPNVQQVRNLPNQALTALPNKSGMWAEVSVPYADLVLANPPGRAPWLENTTTPRAYYSQVFWVDQIKTGDGGQVLYRINDRFGSYGDIFWVAGEALKPITPEDVAPISPDVEDKKVVVDVTTQTMSCFEGKDEVRFCRVSTGAKFDAEGNPVDKWSTPIGVHNIWRKLISIHMAGGTTGGGYDLPGIGWTTLFSPNGVAVHSTFWHNNYGVPMSHGCVNARPEDAKFIWRWTRPQVDYDPGDLTVQGAVGTKIHVVET